MLREFNDGIKKMFQEFFNKDTNKRQRANMWTFSRLVLAFGIPIMAFLGKLMINPLFYFLAAGLTMLGTITDFFDGRSARKHNSTSEFGKKLDILADKVFAFMLGISLSLINPLFLFNILGEFIISYTNIAYQKKYKRSVPRSSNLGKIKQWPLSIAFILGYLSIFLPQLNMATNIFILISFIMELVVSKNYADQNKLLVKGIKQNTSIIESHNEDMENEKTLKDEYIKLRDILLEIKKIKENDIEKNDIKIKKRK